MIPADMTCRVRGHAVPGWKRWPLRRVFKRSAKFAWRMLVLIGGMFLLIVGIIMIFTPGPAVVFIPAGLALLATEFEWARRILHRVRPLIDAAIEKAKRKKGRSPRIGPKTLIAPSEHGEDFLKESHTFRTDSTARVMTFESGSSRASQIVDRRGEQMRPPGS